MVPHAILPTFYQFKKAAFIISLPCCLALIIFLEVSTPSVQRSHLVREAQPRLEEDVSAQDGAFLELAKNMQFPETNSTPEPIKLDPETKPDQGIRSQSVQQDQVHPGLSLSDGDQLADNIPATFKALQPEKQDPDIRPNLGIRQQTVQSQTGQSEEKVPSPGSKDNTSPETFCKTPTSPKCCHILVTLTSDSSNNTKVKYHLNSSLNLLWSSEKHASLSVVYPDCRSTPLLEKSNNLNTFKLALNRVPVGSILIGVADSKVYGEYLDKQRVVQKLFPENGVFVAFVIVSGNYGASRGYAFPYQDKTWWKSICFSSPFALDLALHPWPTLTTLHRDVAPGGSWRPLTCAPRQRLAVIIPYRDRDVHLRIFLQNMHTLLKKQDLDYTIYIVEHTCPTIFNRAILQNIGFLEAMQEQRYDCFLFQDVDLLPQKMENVHMCEDMPRHMVVTRNNTHYHMFSLRYFGGGIMMSRGNVEAINGFTNKIWGWGGEDNNAYFRVLKAGMAIQRYPAEIASYTMLTHTRDLGNPRNNLIVAEEEATDPARDPSIPFVFDEEYQAANDGLSTLKYQLIWKKKQPLYTHILTRVQGPSLSNASHCTDSTMAES